MRKSIGMGKELYSPGSAEQMRIEDVELQVLLNIVDINTAGRWEQKYFLGDRNDS